MADWGSIFVTFFENLARLLPRRTISEWEQGIKLRRGRIVEYRRPIYEEEEVPQDQREEETLSREGVGRDLGAYVTADDQSHPIQRKRRIIGYETTKNIGPGVKWYWPVLEEVVIQRTSRVSVETQRQDITTSDDKIVNVSVGVTYHIFDTATYYTHLYEERESMLNIAERIVAGELGRFSYNELRERYVRKPKQQTSDLEQLLRERMDKEAKQYGITVDAAGLINFAAVRTYRVIGNASGGTPGENGGSKA